MDRNIEIKFLFQKHQGLVSNKSIFFHIQKNTKASETFIGSL